MGDYLKQRRKGWAFQMRVPPDVRERLGKGPVINEGVDTRDRDLAEARAAQRAGYYKMTFEALRGDPHAAADRSISGYPTWMALKRCDACERRIFAPQC